MEGMPGGRVECRVHGAQGHRLLRRHGQRSRRARARTPAGRRRRLARAGLRPPLLRAAAEREALAQADAEALLAEGATSLGHPDLPRHVVLNASTGRACRRSRWRRAPTWWSSGLSTGPRRVTFSPARRRSACSRAARWRWPSRQRGCTSAGPHGRRLVGAIGEMGDRSARRDRGVARRTARGGTGPEGRCRGRSPRGGLAAACRSRPGGGDRRGAVRARDRPLPGAGPSARHHAALLRPRPEVEAGPGIFGRASKVLRAAGSQNRQMSWRRARGCE